MLETNTTSAPTKRVRAAWRSACASESLDRSGSGGAGSEITFASSVGWIAEGRTVHRAGPPHPLLTQGQKLPVFFVSLMGSDFTYANRSAIEASLIEGKRVIDTHSIVPSVSTPVRTAALN